MPCDEGNHNELRSLASSGYPITDIPAVSLTLLDRFFLTVNLHDDLGAIGSFDTTVADNQLADQIFGGNGPFPTVFEAHFYGACAVSVVPVGHVR